MNASTIFALILFVLTYVFMFSMQKIRPVIAVFSATGAPAGSNAKAHAEEVASGVSSASAGKHSAAAAIAR